MVCVDIKAVQLLLAIVLLAHRERVADHGVGAVLHMVWRVSNLLLTFRAPANWVATGAVYSHPFLQILVSSGFGTKLPQVDPSALMAMHECFLSAKKLNLQASWAPRNRMMLLLSGATRRVGAGEGT